MIRCLPPAVKGTPLTRGTCLLVLAGVLILTAGRLAAQDPPSVIVDAAFTGRDSTLIGGVPVFRTLGAALAADPPGRTAPYVVRLRAGRYYEKLTVDKPAVHLVGEGRDVTVLTYDAASDTPRPEGGTYGTEGSFTLRISAPDFRAEHLTIENGFDYMANLARPADAPARFRNPQAVAVMTAPGSDRAVFVDCRIWGHQDTLFADAGRHYFYRSIIGGSVDFIFGAGQAVFEACEIVSRDRDRRPWNGYVTAASTPMNEPYGFLFVDSRLVKEAPELAAGTVALGRPWHPRATPTAFGSVVFVRCWMDDHVAAAGWQPMGSTDASGRRFEFRPENARFFEYGSTGPGAISSPTRRVLTDGEVRAYTPAQVLGGWTPVR